MTAVTENKQTNTQTNKKNNPPPLPQIPCTSTHKKKRRCQYTTLPPPPTRTTAHSCFLLGVSHLSVHKRDTCPDGASPWIVVLLCPWSLLQVRRLTCACALASHMSLQQATIVVCALVLFLAGSSSHIVPHRGSMVIAFSTARRPGDRQAPALTLQHTHTHTTHSLSLPLAPGAWAPLGYFFKKPVVCCNLALSIKKAEL